MTSTNMPKISHSFRLKVIISYKSIPSGDLAEAVKASETHRSSRVAVVTVMDYIAV